MDKIQLLAELSTCQSRLDDARAEIAALARMRDEIALMRDDGVEAVQHAHDDDGDINIHWFTAWQGRVDVLLAEYKAMKETP